MQLLMKGRSLRRLWWCLRRVPGAQGQLAQQDRQGHLVEEERDLDLVEEEREPHHLQRDRMLAL